MKLCTSVERSMILTPELAQQHYSFSPVSISVEKFGELARTSKDSEEGQNTVFQEFKEKEQKSESQKSEGFWNKVEGLFERGWK